MKTILPKNGQKFVALICLTITLLFVLSAFVHTTSDGNQSPVFQPVQTSPAPPTASEIAENQIDVGMWLVNVFNYEYTAGAYTMDMYIYFFWTNPNISTIDWYFANGYPITPTSVTLIGNSTLAGVRYEAYRATARLSSTPNAMDFPFDKINLTVTIDVFTHGNNLTLNWLPNETGLDQQFKNSGWRTDDVELYTSIHNFPLGVQAPRAEMVVIQERQRVSTSVSPFLTPAIFALVSAVSFLFSLKEMAAVGLRIGLNTSMLVATLLFSFNVVGGIPPSSTVVLYATYLLAVLIFMVCNLIVTIIGVVGWTKYHDEHRTKLANRLGFLISIVVPVIVFALLYFLR